MLPGVSLYRVKGGEAKFLERIGASGFLYFSLYLFSYLLLIGGYEGFVFYLPKPPPAEWAVAIMSVKVPVVQLVQFLAYLLLPKR